MDNALCGGDGATLSGTALSAVKAAIFMVSIQHINNFRHDLTL